MAVNKQEVLHMISIYQARYDYLQKGLQRDLSERALEEMYELADVINIHRQILTEVPS